MMQKRIVAIALALAMVMTLLPFSVWAEGEEAAVGSLENPAELTLGINTAVIEEGSVGYYFNWTADEDCILQINMPELTEENGLTGWYYYLMNMTTLEGGDMHYSDEDPLVSTASVEVSVGDLIELCVCTYDPADPSAAPAGELSVEVLTTYPEGSVNNPIFLSGDAVVTIPAGETVYYSGRFGGSSLSATGTGVTLAHNGAEYVLSDEATVFECYQESNYSPSIFELTNTTDADVEVTLVLIVPVGTYENPAQLVLGENTVVIEEGNDQGYYLNWTAEEDGVLYLVMPTDADWQYTVNDMTNYQYGASRNSAEGTASNPAVVEVTAGTKLQIIVNSFDPADVNHYPGATLAITALMNCAHEYTYTVEAKGQHTAACSVCLLTVTEAHTYVDGVCACGEAEPTTYTVYFQNNWNWQDVYAYYWGSESDPAWPGIAMTPYGIENGYEIYVCEIPSGITGLLFNGVKDDGSGNRDQSPDITAWYEGVCYYMAWDETNGCNAYGSYELAAADSLHVHTLDEGVVTAPTCTEDGYTTYTCADCADDETTEELENTFVGNWTGATGHAYADGVCTNCGAAEPNNITVYCINSKNWDAVNAYIWNSTGNNSWPGVAMELTEETVNGYAVYAYTFSKDYVNIIFNNGSGSQTADLTVMEGQYYDLQTNTWYASLSDVPEVDPLSTNVYLVGSFNSWSTTASQFTKANADDTVASVSLELEASTTYEFKIVNDGAWYSDAVAITGTAEGLTFAGNGDNSTITTGEAGTYVFTWDTANSTLSVTYPQAQEPAEEISGTNVAVTADVPVVVDYTAQTNGVLSVTISGNPGYQISVADSFGETVGLPKSAKAEQTVTYDLVAGNTYTVTMYAYNTSAWTTVDGTVSYSITFTPTEDDEEVEPEEYIVSETVLVLGDNALTPEENALTSIYAFSPEEMGVYTFTAPEGAIVGIWGYNWVQGDPNSTSNICEWTCTGVGQSVLIGVSGVEGAFVVNVAKTGEYNPIVYTEVVYENKAELSAYTLPGCATLGDYVDVTQEHSAVLGDDGYYHLDSADGPILLIDLDYEGIVLSDKLDSDIPTMYLYTDEQLDDGSYIKYDIKYALAAIDEEGPLYNAEYDMVSYEDVMSAEGYYPLTEDLILFYKDYATAQGVWSFYVPEDVQYKEDTVWMYCCRTVTITHSELTHVEAKEATCTAEGNLEYWTCANCGDAWLDAECIVSTDLLAVTLPMAEHNYVNHVCSICGDMETFVKASGLNLRLQDLLKLGFYFQVTTDEEILNAGALLWTADQYAQETDLTVSSTIAKQYTGLEEVGGSYAVETDGIYAQYLDTVYYFRPYVETVSGIVYGDVVNASALTYANIVYNGSSYSADLKSLVIDLLNYATAARTYFGYTEGIPAPEAAFNSILSDADQVVNWSEDMKAGVQVISESDTAFSPTPYGVNTNLLEAIALNMMFTDGQGVEGMLYWNANDYAANDVHDATTATGDLEVTDGGAAVYSSVTGIYAFQMYDNYYFRAYDAEGNLSNTYCVSVASYLTTAANQYANATSEEDVAFLNLVKAMMVYGTNAQTNPEINKG